MSSLINDLPQLKSDSGYQHHPSVYDKLYLNNEFYGVIIGISKKDGKLAAMTSGWIRIGKTKYEIPKDIDKLHSERFDVDEEILLRRGLISHK